MVDLEKIKVYSEIPQNFLRKEQKSRIDDIKERFGDSIQIPDTAYNGAYVDKKCPFIGDIKLLNYSFKGTVRSMKQPRTISVVKNKLHYISKYRRFERRRQKIPVHFSPAFEGRVDIGDVVYVVATQPISKTVHYVVVGVVKKAQQKVVSKL